MSDRQNMTPLKELNLTNRFLFDEVMGDAGTLQETLSILFGREIPLLEKSETEKELRMFPGARSIRMDVYAMDEERTVYNAEMQAKRKNDLAKRSRYYQALVDTNLLESGIPNYNVLNQSYIIMFMPFDLFGYGRYVYTFRPRCEEEPECTLDDKAVRIFLNTRGKNDSEVTPELADFLHYLEDTTDERAEMTTSKRIKRIHERVKQVKQNEKIGVKYMQAWEERYYAEQEGREQGLEEGLKQGREQGIKQGREQGLEQGREAGIRAMISDNVDEGIPEARIIEKLKKYYNLQREESETYLRRFSEEKEAKG